MPATPFLFRFRFPFVRHPPSQRSQCCAIIFLIRPSLQERGQLPPCKKQAAFSFSQARKLEDDTCIRGRHNILDVWWTRANFLPPRPWYGGHQTDWSNIKDSLLLDQHGPKRTDPCVLHLPQTLRVGLTVSAEQSCNSHLAPVSSIVAIISCLA